LFGLFDGDELFVVTLLLKQSEVSSLLDLRQATSVPEQVFREQAVTVDGSGAAARLHCQLAPRTFANAKIFALRRWCEIDSNPGV
jgi:hypothetical protein